MKFFIVLFLVGLAGTLVHGEETPSNSGTEDTNPSSANPELSEETAPESTTDPATTPDSTQTTLAAKKPSDKLATTQKTKYKITGIPKVKDVSSHIKEKIEEAEEKIKNKIDEINDIRKIYKKFL